MIKKIFLLIIALIGLVRLYYSLTDDFTVRNFTGKLFSAPATTMPLALQQTFRYIGKGCQTYALASEDGQYILKLFKFKHLKRHPEKQQALFASYHLGFEEAAEETGVLFVHLAETPSSGRLITIIDKLGLRHKIDLDKIAFVLQKRALPLPEVMASMNEEQITCLMHNVVCTLEALCQKGLIDQDPALLQNIGLADGHPILFDLGQLIKKEEMRDPALYRPYIHKQLAPFHAWLARASSHSVIK